MTIMLYPNTTIMKQSFLNVFVLPTKGWKGNCMLCNCYKKKIKQNLFKIKKRTILTLLWQIWSDIWSERTEITQSARPIVSSQQLLHGTPIAPGCQAGGVRESAVPFVLQTQVNYSN